MERLSSFLVSISMMCLMTPLYSTVRQSKISVMHAAINSQATVLFAHGLVDTYRQAYEYVEEQFHGYTKKFSQFNRFLYSLKDTNLVSVIFDDGANPGYKKYYHARLSTLGQGAEIDRIKQAYDQHNLQYQQTVIFHGCSRGSAAMLGFIAKYNPENEHQLLVLTDCYASVKDAIEQKSMPACAKQAAYKFIRTVFQYKDCGEHPIEQIKHIKNKDMDIIIVCSQEDNLVHWKSSENLYKAFLEHGFTNVTFIKLKSGKHAKGLWAADGEQFQKSVRQFQEKQKKA